MNKLNVFLLAVILIAFVGCGESKQSKPESKTITQKQPENQTKADSVFLFNADRVGKMPVGWTNYFTGKGKLWKWEISDDGGNKVLTQVSQKNFGYHFDVIVLDSSDYQYLEMTLKINGVKGEEDQGGGPLWRYQDADNYYIARANPLENNFRVYKLIVGNRKQLASADINIPTGEWHTIQIRMVDNHIECFYDGKKYIDVIDDTFKNSGKVDLWTKVDAFTYFDDLKIVEK